MTETWIQDAIAHINAFVAAGGSIESPDFPDTAPVPTLEELAELYPLPDCPVCNGTDPGCRYHPNDPTPEGDEE